MRTWFFATEKDEAYGENRNGEMDDPIHDKVCFS